jgi:hypothetical protein
MPLTRHAAGGVARCAPAGAGTPEPSGLAHPPRRQREHHADDAHLSAGRVVSGGEDHDRGGLVAGARRCRRGNGRGIPAGTRLCRTDVLAAATQGLFAKKLQRLFGHEGHAAVGTLLRKKPNLRKTP